MEEELRCPHCRSFYHVPVLLQCRHALCLNCANSLQKPPVAHHEDAGHDDVPEVSEADKVSVLSDADSGVSCSSRPTSITGTSDAGSVNTASEYSRRSHSPAFNIACPKCGVVTEMDSGGADNLPQFRVLSAVVDKYIERLQVAELCQLCVSGESNSAQVFCDQCLVFYCDSCRETCHPPRGPLAGHWLMSVSEGRCLLRSRRRERDGRCITHSNEAVSMYCLTCKLPLCLLCLQNGRHHAHDVHALNSVTKKHKTELSQSLQQLSEKARGATEFIHKLKSSTDDVLGNCREVEGVLVAQIDALTEALQTRRSTLINWVRQQRDAKVRTLREQAQEYTQTLQSTTGTIHFCIEALKDSDPTTFMEAQDVMEERIESLTNHWSHSMKAEPRVTTSFALSLDDKTLLAAINRLTFIQLRPPGPPGFLHDECSAANNSVTVSWYACKNSATSGYLLEIDDGTEGAFREVYSGPETVCTIDGLHFDSLYRVRMRAFNAHGISSYSDILRLQTAKIACFCLEERHSDFTLSEENCCVSCDSYEHRIVLGSVGFSRGSHYWQFVIRKYDGNKDVAFGVATRDITREGILGKCASSWSMYIDSDRSWLMHSGEHFNRTKGGIKAGDIVGILLSWQTKTLAFYVNDYPQGTIQLGDRPVVLVPAVSINRSVSVFLQTGLPISHRFRMDSKESVI